MAQCGQDLDNQAAAPRTSNQRGQFDYAGRFPPAPLDDGAAVAEFADHRKGGPTAWLMQRFVLPLSDSARAKALTLALDGAKGSAAAACQGATTADSVTQGPVLMAGLLPAWLGVEPDAQAVMEQALAKVASWASLEPCRAGRQKLDAIEWALPLAEASREQWSTWREPLRRALAQLVTLRQGARVFVEVSWAQHPQGMPLVFERLAELAEPLAPSPTAKASLGLKIRTGGLQAVAVPPAPVLASLIAGCVQARDPIPFKCTAGLHGALHEISPRFGFEMHGFMNILALAGCLMAKVPVGQAVDLLSQRTKERLEGAVTNLCGESLLQTAARGRQLFTSFGSCSVVEPLESLVAHGWIENTV
jgi:hypothetical protein